MNDPSTRRRRNDTKAQATAKNEEHKKKGLAQQGGVDPLPTHTHANISIFVFRESHLQTARSPDLIPVVDDTRGDAMSDGPAVSPPPPPPPPLVAPTSPAVAAAAAAVPVAVVAGAAAAVAVADAAAPAAAAPSGTEATMDVMRADWQML